MLQLNGFKSSKWLNSSIWSIDGTLIDITTPGQSGPGSNDSERVLHIPQSSRTGTSPSDGLVSYSGYLVCVAECRDVVGRGYF